MVTATRAKTIPSPTSPYSRVGSWEELEGIELTVTLTV
jgi:hypothetical protein